MTENLIIMTEVLIIKTEVSTIKIETSIIIEIVKEEMIQEILIITNSITIKNPSIRIINLKKGLILINTQRINKLRNKGIK
jgi:hypothetical protein